MIVYIENPIESTKKLLKLITNLAKLQDPKPIVFLYSRNKQLEMEFKNNSIYKSIKILRNKINEKTVRLVRRKL